MSRNDGSNVVDSRSRRIHSAVLVALSALALPQGYVVGLIAGTALYHVRVGTRRLLEGPPGDGRDGES